MGAGAPYRLIPFGILFASNFRMQLNEFCIWNGIGEAWIFITDFRIFHFFRCDLGRKVNYYRNTI